MRVIFLDIDGVLNDHNTHNKSFMGFIGVADKYLRPLQLLYEETGAEIVLISDWKAEWNKDKELCNPDGEYLNFRFAEFGMRIANKTMDNSSGDDLGSGRGAGIKRYLAENDVSGYVVLDDGMFWDYDETIKGHLIYLSGKMGFTVKHIDEAERILNIEASE